MILIWKGLGVLVFVLWTVGTIASWPLTDWLYGPDAEKGVRHLLGLWLSALLTLLFALGLRAYRRWLVNPWDRLDAPPSQDSLFWIPVIYWPAIFFVLGLIAYVK